MWITPPFYKKILILPPLYDFSKISTPYEGVHITMFYFYWRRSDIFFIAYLAVPAPRAVEEKTFSLT